MHRLLAGLAIALGCHLLLLMVPIIPHRTISPHLPKARGISVGLNRIEPEPPRNNIRSIPPPPKSISPLKERIEKSALPKRQRKPAPKPKKPRKKPVPALPPEPDTLPLPKKEPDVSRRNVPDKRQAEAALPDQPEFFTPKFPTKKAKGPPSPPITKSGTSAEKKGKETLRTIRAYPKTEGNPPPKYPVLARRRGWQGTVQLSVLVLENGRVGDIAITKSSGYPILDKTALEAVARYRFVPGKKDGRPIPMRVRVPVHFRLEDDN